MLPPRRPVRVALILLFIAILVPVPVAADEACVMRGAPAVWRITDENTTITLVGTVHRLREGEYRLPAALADGRFQIVVFESRALSAWGTLQAALRARAPQNLEQALTPQQWTRLRSLADRVGVPQATLQRLDPFLLAGALEEKAIGLVGRENASGADTWLKRELGRRSEQTRYLEDQREIFTMIRNINYQSKVNFLLDTMARLESESAWTFVDAWVSGDECELERQAADVSRHADDEPLYREIHEGLVLGRNRLFADQILDLLNTDGQHVVVVGALHFYGPGNIREMLEAAGYRVLDVAQDPT